MRHHVVCVLIWLCAVSGIGADIDCRQPLRLDTGLVAGVVNPSGDTVAFKGIPYAAPPVGKLRWRDPQPPSHWEGIRKAAKYGASCTQRIRNGQPADQGEDCLFLNVWAPVTTSTEARPVLFFIHGGADRFGSGSDEGYAGEALAKKGIIVVTVNFRLGIFGGFAHPELTAESPWHTSGNYGFLDTIAALQWVRTNIAAFGGDPAKVTIAGQSSGAHTVHWLTVSPLAKGLFQRAIAVSFPQYILIKDHFIGDLAEREAHGLRFAALKRAKTLAELRAMPAAALIADDPLPGSMQVHGIIKDGRAVPDYYVPSYEHGQAADVPIMTGLTADDFGVLARYSKTTVASFQAAARREFGDHRTEFLRLYPAATDQEAREMDKQVQNERGMAEIFFWATWKAKHTKAPVYTYFFTQAAPNPERPELGASHGSDLVYEFDNLNTKDRPWTDHDRRVADQVSSYWVNFIKTGDPNGDGLPRWAPVDAGNPTTMVLGVPCGPRQIAEPGRMDFHRRTLAK